jgi:hypothetical protein
VSGAAASTGRAEAAPATRQAFGSRLMAVDVSSGTSRGRVLGDAVSDQASWRSRLGREGLLVLLVGGYAGLLLSLAGFLVSTDSWYALVGGRLIVRHGLPSHNTITLWAHGARWVDQQWLAQLAFYGLDRAGGIRLAVAVHVALLVGALAASMALARRRGADPTSVAIVAAVAFIPLVLSSAQLRTQSFAYLLFVAIVALVTSSAAVSLKRLSLLLAIVVLWSNLHGSAALGAGLVSLRGLADLRNDLRGGKRLTSAWLTAALPWPSLMLTPYLLSTTHYYRETIFNSTLSHYLAQWQPSTLSILSLPLFALAVGFFWLLGRAGSAYTGFEKVAGIALVGFGLLATRNWVWLCLFAIALYPKALDRIRTVRRTASEPRLNRFVGAAGIGIAVVGAAVAISRPPSSFTPAFPSNAARAVGTLADAHPGARIWATEQWADWLLWENPRLEGRMAFDARVELLTAAQVKRMTVFSATPLLVRQVRRHYAIIVVSKGNEPDTYRVLRREGPVVYDDGKVLVVSSLKDAA